MFATLTYKRLAAALALTLCVSLTPARAAEPYASATQAYRLGLESYRAGKTVDALRALDYAADRGVLGALLKLAKIYAAGEGGVKRNDAKAFQYYQRVADQYAETSPFNPVSRYVADAFVALGHYHLAGVPSLSLDANPGQAAGMFRHAASYFGDADAQYQLAKLHLAGDGVPRDVALAVNWLTNAAKKQHVPSVALLGDIMWRGDEGMRKQRVKGLALMAWAREHGGPDEAAFIDSLYKRALGDSENAEREGAETLVASWRRRPSSVGEVAATEAKPEEPAKTPPPARKSGAQTPASQEQAGPGQVTPISTSPPAITDTTQPTTVGIKPSAGLQNASPDAPVASGR